MSIHQPPQSLAFADAALVATATKAQTEALAPTHSVWVAANAGTGKTTVLTQRLVVLLLTDPTLEPRHLLALTFTRAAAAEMAVRLPKLFDKLAALPEADLAQELAQKYGLLAHKLPTPPMPRLQLLQGLVRQQPPLITTLHGFAQQLLMALPGASGAGANAATSANAAANAAGLGLQEGFVLLEEYGQNTLLQQVQNQLLTNLPPHLAPHLNTLLDDMGEQAWADLTRTIIKAWWRLAEILGTAGLAVGLPALLNRLASQLNLPTDGVLYAPLQPPAALQKTLVSLGKPCVTEAEWMVVLLPKTMQSVRKSILTKAQQKQGGAGVEGALQALAQEALQRVQQRRAKCGLRLTEALLVWAAHVQAAYTQAKQQQGLADFADLLVGLEHLLANAETEAAGAWLWHRLDRRFRHLVVDEAQDNNAAQARIIAWLAQQLLAGEVGSGPRTVLAVGDVKQSIYRFQGAQPAWFLALRTLLNDWATPKPIIADLTYTFRNGQAVMDVVNSVFDTPEHAATLQGEMAPWPTHNTVVPARPCRVEVWPLVTGADDEEAAADTPNGDTPNGEEPATNRWLLAPERAAQAMPSAKLVCLQQVASWLVAQHAAGVVMPSTGKPLGWDDVLIVVQKNETARLLAALLRRAGVPVAASQGQVPVSVQDVVALLRALFNPTDTVALAQACKGLDGATDADLLALAARGWALDAAANTGVAGFIGHHTALVAPAVLVQRALGWWGLAAAPFMPLLAWAEAAAATPNPRLGALGTLLDRLEREDLPVVAGGGVRILTVHRAKGLEAPLVILPETTPKLDEVKETLLWADDVVLYKQGKNISSLEDTLLAKTAAERRADNLRGLYVGLTRAADWLVIAGWARRGAAGAVADAEPV